ncbi:sensor histidine kinase [Rubripirellula obstinata]|nr:HAMP domain-containing sensor histidine kinase [Rubripirellula obstinata]
MLGQGSDVDRLRQPVITALESDPALLLYCALCCSDETSSQSSFTVADLADWLIAKAVQRFSSGDAMMGSPKSINEHDQKIQKLNEHYLTLPISRWMDDAVLWLEAFGPKVSAAWQQQWPTVTAPTNGIVSADQSTTSADPLQQLARTMQRLKSMDNAFDARLKKSKLGAIKQLAYGLSHEINNPLANISTRAQSLQRGEDDPSKVATLQRIIDQVYRAHEMIADLMFYANPPLPEPTPSHLNPLIEQVADSFREQAERQSIRLELSLPKDSADRNVDEGMLSEAVRVLIRNAIEAIGCQGTVVVSLVEQGSMTQIHVADSGPGLSAEAREHAFDPYFSGREAGRGLGLGLCRAYRIAQLHHAEISLAGGPAGCVATITLRDV